MSHPQVKPSSGAHVQADDQPHGHHVMSLRGLLLVLFALVALTALTVYTAKEWQLGLLGNASLAIVIATVKCTLVCMYFMHLRYDNHFYTVILLSCLSLLVIFLFFSMVDLGTRGSIDPMRARLGTPVPKDMVGVARFSDPALAEGRKLYAANCAQCHGPNGLGVNGLGSPLVVAANDARIPVPFMSGNSDVQLIEFIKQGRMPNDPNSVMGLAMPPYGGNVGLTDEQLLAIVKFTRALAVGGHGKESHGASEAH
ncbi:c-type cytochrome [Geitlerinema splendidum]|nr:c-type cytochrome [Geitlerinema splendidum]